MGDLLFGVIATELDKRGLKAQRDVIAFVQKQTGLKLPQQAVSKIANGQIKKPRQSVYVLAMLFALGRDGAGKPRPAESKDGVDEKALELSVLAVEEAIDGVVGLTPQGRAIAYTFVYQVLIADGKAPTRATILQFCRRQA